MADPIPYNPGWLHDSSGAFHQRLPVCAPKRGPPGAWDPHGLGTGGSAARRTAFAISADQTPQIDQKPQIAWDGRRRENTFGLDIFVCEKPKRGREDRRTTPCSLGRPFGVFTWNGNPESS